MQWAAAWALVKTLQASPARLKGVSSPNEPRHLSCSLHQQQNPFIDNKKIGNDYWTVNGLNPLGEALPTTTFPGPGGYARKGRDLTSWSTSGGVGAGGSTRLLVPTINAKGILENLSRGMRMAEWNMTPLPTPPRFTTLCCLCKVYERSGKSVISVCKKTQRGNRCILKLWKSPLFSQGMVFRVFWISTWCVSYLSFSYFYSVYCCNSQLIISSWKLHN